MSRALVLIFLCFALLLAGLASLRGSLLALAMPPLLYLSYGLWRSPRAIQLKVWRELSAERVAAGSPVAVTLTLLNAGDDVDELSLEDAIDPALKVADGSNRRLISLPRGARFSFEYTVLGPRGGFAFERLHMEGGDDLGILHLRQDLPTPGQLYILPPSLRIHSVPIRPRRTRVYAGSIPARVGGAGVEFYGVRNCEPGDSPRHINWRVSARQMEDLYSNEFLQERVADVGIVLDGREKSNLFPGNQSLFEHSVLAAGALAEALLNQGNRVGLLIYGRFVRWTLPGYGKRQLERIRHALSDAAAGGSQIFDDLRFIPTRAFPAESQIVMVSPLLRDDYPTLIQLRARRYQVMLISPDPVSFEQRHLERSKAGYSGDELQLAARVARMERNLLVGRLQRAGVKVVEWDVAEPFAHVTRRAFGRRMRYENRL